MEGGLLAGAPGKGSSLLALSTPRVAKLGNSATRPMEKRRTTRLTMSVAELEAPEKKLRASRVRKSMDVHNRTLRTKSLIKSRKSGAANSVVAQLRGLQGCAHTAFESPLGRITVLASPQGVHAVLLPGKDGSLAEQDEVARRVPHAPEDPLLCQARRQLTEYFAGQRPSFSLPLAPLGGTPFQRRVWASLEQIPFGGTVSYGEQALSLGLPRAASRAVGAASGRNPLAIVLPCHRVVGKSGLLIGYAGGLEKKAFLLKLEANAAA